MSDILSDCEGDDGLRKKRGIVLPLILAGILTLVAQLLRPGFQGESNCPQTADIRNLEGADPLHALLQGRQICIGKYQLRLEQSSGEYIICVASNGVERRMRLENDEAEKVKNIPMLLRESKVERKCGEMVLTLKSKIGGRYTMKIDELEERLDSVVSQYTKIDGTIVLIIGYDGKEPFMDEKYSVIAVSMKPLYNK